jgi:hypothetical protein
MTDIIDLANDHIERENLAMMAALENFEIAEGRAGECDLCGEWFCRLVDGVCVPCRNKYEKRQKILR